VTAGLPTIWLAACSIEVERWMRPRPAAKKLMLENGGMEIMRKSSIYVIVLALVLVLALPLTAHAMPEYSSDGTCAGEGCHEEGEYADIVPQEPTPAETETPAVATETPAPTEAPAAPVTPEETPAPTEAPAEGEGGDSTLLYVGIGVVVVAAAAGLLIAGKNKNK
jgi:hypothetical protein